MTGVPQHQGPATDDADISPAREVRRLLRQAVTATLGTLDRRSGHPHASLIQMATTTVGDPTFLISGLAAHTRNLAADPRASILVDQRQAGGDALAGARATLIGRAKPGIDAGDRRRFLARHPTAVVYAGLGDFEYWTLVVERIHVIGGFGRIRELNGTDVLAPTALSSELANAEPRVLGDLNAANEHHLRARDRDSCDWIIIGADAQGLDLQSADDLVRLEFARLAGSLEDLSLLASDACRSLQGDPIA